MTPKGLSVNDLHISISFNNFSLFIAPEPISPSPPAFDTALANSPVAMRAIPPCINGYFIPSNFVKFLPLK